jgi:hypothetical protein
MTTRQLLLAGFSIILLLSCSQSGYKTNEQQIGQKGKVVDTTFYFIKRLLNASPIEVEKVLGKPDSEIQATNDCVSLPNCSIGQYHNGKYEFEYLNDRVKCVTIYLNGDKSYNENFLNMLNFTSEPYISNNVCIRWRNIKGISDIAIFGDPPRGIDYALIQVEENYNYRFEIIR